MVKKGIDISHWQGKIDFDRLQKNVDFIIIKAGGSDGSLGRVYQDKKFEEYYNKCVEYNIPVGCYFFAGKYSNTSARGINDSTAFYEIIKGKKFDYPVYLDFEVGNKNKKTQNTSYCISFMRELERRKYFTGLYASDISGFKEQLDINRLIDFSWWVARYSTTAPVYATKNLHMWQYSSKGLISGINGFVDMDYCYMDFPTIIKNKGFNGYGC